MAEKEIWTIGKILKWTEQYFAKAGIDGARLDAEVLLSHVLNKERIFLYVHFDQPLEEQELASFKDCIKQRVKHTPVAYITGHKEFMGLDFKVTRATLIPRPDTEILVEAALRRLPAGEACKGIIADIGTGSGAICLSLLKYLPNLQAVTVDISEEAIAVAKENAVKLEVDSRVEFCQGDLLEPVQDRKFMAIVSNPPYIPEGDIAGLDSDVKDHEPMSALVLTEASELLEEKGFLAVEVGIHQAQQLKAMAENMTQWENTEIIKDLAGIERVVVLWKASAEG